MERQDTSREGVSLVEWGTISGKLAISLIINSHKWLGLINFKSIYKNTKDQFWNDISMFLLHLILATILL